MRIVVDAVLSGVIVGFCLLLGASVGWALNDLRLLLANGDGWAWLTTAKATFVGAIFGALAGGRMAKSVCES